MWYDNNIFTGIAALTIIAVFALIRVPFGAKDMVIPVITGIAGIVTGYAAKTIKDAVTSRTTTTKEEVSNAEPKFEE